MKKIFLLSALLFFISASFAQNFNITYRGQVTYPYSCASIWGYVDDDGTEYALVGTYNGVSIVDVSDPENPVVKFDVDHDQSEWREIKTYGHYAYATNETGGGLLVIDLSDLPNSVQKYTFIYTDNEGNKQKNGHTLFIDENGRLYIFGGAYNGEGATMFDLTVDPVNPPFVGEYEEHYIHDGFVRGDTLWASEIYDGQVELVNVSDPSDPVPMASFNTPNFFSHNSWPTHDNHYVFTTDEVDDSYLTSYDVSDLTNISELDRVQSNPGSDVIIHNVHLYNDQFAVVAYYKDGVVLFDVSHPDNMIEVGSYDTDPGESGGNYGGTWGVYPYLPSGNIIASDLSDAGSAGGKLTVMTPTYVAASWLEGNVTDTTTGAPVSNAYVELVGTFNTDYSDLGGLYKTGNGVAGSFSVQVSKVGYETKTVQNVTLTNGIVTALDIQLVPLTAIALTGTVYDSVTNQPLANAQVFVHGITNGLTLTVTADANGVYTASPLYEDTYDVFVGKWGYHENGLGAIYITQNNASQDFVLAPGYYDDFILNNNWTVSGNAQTGAWERGDPVGTYNQSTPFNPESDVTGDWGTYCFVTGNGGGGAGDDDVDDGTTSLTSPVFNVTDYSDPVVYFTSWFANGGGSGNPNDTLKVFLMDGSSTVLIAKIRTPMSQWVNHSYHINEFLTPNSTMQVMFQASDLASSGHLVEAGVDLFKIENDYTTGIAAANNDIHCNSFPNPFTTESTFGYNLGKEYTPGAKLEIYNVLGQKQESYFLTSASGTVTWGNSLDNGIYFLKLFAGNTIQEVIPVVKTK